RFSALRCGADRNRLRLERTRPIRLPRGNHIGPACHHGCGPRHRHRLHPRELHRRPDLRLRGSESEGEMSIGTPKQPTNAPITEAARRDPVDPGRKRWQIRFPKALRTPLGFVGAGILVIWLLVAIFAPLLAPFDPLAQNFPRLSAPNGENLLGTDTLGRDVLSRILVAARTT